jgi:hypothetical protein
MPLYQLGNLGSVEWDLRKTMSCESEEKYKEWDVSSFRIEVLRKHRKILSQDLWNLGRVAPNTSWFNEGIIAVF